MVVTSRSPQETEAIGHQIGRTLRSGAVLGLFGELGAGKTCLARGVARALGVGGPVTSPTFTLVNEYHGTLTVYHVDAYRTEGPAELADLGLDEYFDGEGVTVVEWADKLGSLLPKGAILIDIVGVGDEPRTITVRGLDR